ncbi:probable G-protein coupled receptor 75 [Pristis pectinata]|uniref:probable G-protein coupled receptor 75 n=1 Tax=Pristis pectinata TaxID=685728 RepID=UPI00223E623D|nr:probable G-protein coupled receptor 75 [Pristis pectinata]
MNLTHRRRPLADQSFPNVTNSSTAWVTENETAGHLQELIRTATLTTCTLLLLLTFCLGTYGNLVVFLSFFDPAFRKFRTNFDFMILNLSFCDLFICCVTTPMFAFILFFDSDSSVSEAFCFAFHLTSAGLIIMSLKSVTTIALHRLRMVLGQQPNATASSLSTLILTISLWTLSFTLASLATFWTYPESSRVCVPLLGCTSRDGRIILYLYVTDFAFCVGTVSVSYVVIALALKRNAHVRKCAIVTVDTLKTNTLMRTGANSVQTVKLPLYRNQYYNKLHHMQRHSYTQGRTHVQASKNRLQLASSVNLSGTKDSKAVVTCVIIVFSVIVCCLPLGISFLQDVSTPQSSFILNQFKLFGFTLILFKSGLNPFIYSRSSAGLRKRILWCTQCVALGCWCYKHKTWLRAVGKGSLDVNRNKSSHHETNPVYILSPKPQSYGPSHLSGSILNPKVSVGHQKCAQNKPIPINAKIQPYCSIYNSSSSRKSSSPSRSPPMNAVSAFAKSHGAMYYHTAEIQEFVPEHENTSAERIPIPSV